MSGFHVGGARLEAGALHTSEDLTSDLELDQLHHILAIHLEVFQRMCGSTALHLMMARHASSS